MGIWQPFKRLYNAISDGIRPPTSQELLARLGNAIRDGDEGIARDVMQGGRVDARNIPPIKWTSHSLKTGVSNDHTTHDPMNYCFIKKMDGMADALLDGGWPPYGYRTGSKYGPNYMREAVMKDMPDTLASLLRHAGDAPNPEKNGALYEAVHLGKTRYAETLIASNAAVTEDMLAVAHEKGFTDLVPVLEIALENQSMPRAPSHVAPEDMPTVQDISTALNLHSMPRVERQRLLNHLASEFPDETATAVAGSLAGMSAQKRDQTLARMGGILGPAFGDNAPPESTPRVRVAAAPNSATGPASEAEAETGATPAPTRHLTA